MSGNFKSTILVTGANGQVGSELRELSVHFPEFQFLFTGKGDLPIQEKDKVLDFFQAHQVAYCINCAAYTAVDKAESERELAFLINATGAANLAEVCRITKARLVHISTDYVYDGSRDTPQLEDAPVNPINVYGHSKLEGERLVQENNPESVIIRTSWVYSRFGKNFVKTMLRLFKEKDELNVVADQLGSPTYAADLAATTLRFINHWIAGNELNGIFNYANTGVTSWFELADYLRELTGSSCKIHPVTSVQYPTPARRPSYSVLDTTKIRTALGIEIPYWKKSVSLCVEKLTTGEA